MVALTGRIDFTNSVHDVQLVAVMDLRPHGNSLCIWPGTPRNLCMAVTQRGLLA
jgi:hypothetical protein